MASVSSVIWGTIAVGALSALGFYLGQNVSLKLTDEKAQEIAKNYDNEFEIASIIISKNQKCAILYGKNDQALIIKSMGEAYSIRKINNDDMSYSGDFISFRFNEFSFPDFAEQFDRAAS